VTERSPSNIVNVLAEGSASIIRYLSDWLRVGHVRFSRIALMGNGLALDPLAGSIAFGEERL
jgi:hypothetical protein